MIKKGLVVFLVLFFVFTGVSWGIERVEKGIGSLQSFFYIDGGWSFRDGSGPDGGFSVGGGIGGTISKYLNGKFSFRYYRYKEDSEKSREWEKIELFEYNFTAQFSPTGDEIASPFFGASLGVVDGKFDQEYSGDEKWFLAAGFVGGVDFNIDKTSFFNVNFNYLFDITGLFREEEEELGINNMRIAMGIGKRF